MNFKNQHALELSQHCFWYVSNISELVLRSFRLLLSIFVIFTKLMSITLNDKNKWKQMKISLNFLEFLADCSWFFTDFTFENWREFFQIITENVGRFRMSGNYYFVIVGHNDNPLFEVRVVKLFKIDPPYFMQWNILECSTLFFLDGIHSSWKRPEKRRSSPS